MISNYLKALIDSNNRIIIPDFGAFMIQDSPEGKQISFNDFLKFNDGLLVNQIIKTDKISKIQASDRIKEFVIEVEKNFSQNKPYEVLGLGLLSKDSNGNIRFDSKIEASKVAEKLPTDERPTIVLDEESEKVKDKEVVAIPVEEKKPEVPVTPIPKIEEKKSEPIVKPASVISTSAKPNPNMTEKKPVSASMQKQNNTTRNVLIIVAALVIIAAGTFAYLKFGMGEKEVPVVEAIMVPEPVIDTMPAETQEPIVVEEPAVDENVKKFYLVAGSFKVPSNAVGFNNKLISEGYNSEVIVRKNGFHCVSFKTFYTWNEVVAEWRNLKDEKPGIWILIR